ncbi:unnamed protein product [Durusdinium trenchii]|uniref:RNA-dependent RNA polymerase n=1 Tax=Durusdinium trenchii TaxID=1381693 RepID=A0ABP0JW15_9DINO
MVRKRVETRLTEAGLACLVQFLDDWGVEEVEDLLLITKEDLEEKGVKVVPQRKFLRLQESLSSSHDPRAAASAERPLPSSPISPIVPEASDWCFPDLDQNSWELPSFSTDSSENELKQLAEKPGRFTVGCFKVKDGVPRLIEEREQFYRPVQWKLRPEDGWKFITMEFPSESPQLEQLVERFRENGFPYRGRCYFFVSSSKADAYPHGPSAWLASPPSGGREQIDKQLGFNTIFKLEKAGDDIPNPGFRCRARVKQLFSSMIASIPVCKLEIEVIEDFKDVHGVIRDDGGGEADPDILEALAVASKTCQQEVGLCRSVTDSGQIRCAGLKGMLLGSKRLQGTRKLVVPRSMLKFGGAEFSQEHLSVLNFSKIRPTSLGQNVILRLEACGCDPKVLVEEQKRFLRKVTRMGQGDFREGAFHQLYFDKYETEVEAETQGHHVRGWSSKTYIGTFLEMLLSGFDPCQHPLLEVLLRQKKRALERAMKQVQLGGCWSARGHPEPQGEGNDLELTDNEIFLMVPSEAEEIGWTALTGHVIVNYLSDRDPHALRLALAKDSPALRAKCAPGVLYFSKQGRPLQVNLSWDFDGDYFQVITQQRLVNSFRGEDSANCFLPEFEAEMKDVEAKSLSDVHAHFLSEYHLKDRIGLHHYQWEMLAGEGPKAACSDQARRTAVAYSKSLDVEKGKPCPKLGKLARQPKWDFMKKPGGPQRPSPTAAGECYRQALQANQEFDEAKAPRNTSPDQDLSKAWKELLDQHGPQKCQKMKVLAKEVRGDFLKRVAIEINKAECAAGMGNSYTACYDELRGEWFLEMRKNVLRQAEKQDITPEQLALASWHLKYVDEGVCTECRDPNPSFPWLLFKAELSQCKEHWQPCLRSELYQFHGAMRKLQRNIGEASASERKKQKTDEAIECLKAKLKCPLCSATKNELLDKLHIPGPLLEAAAAVKGISGRGDVEYVDCERLRFAKAQFGDTLEHGKQSGTKLEELVDQLVRGEVAVRELVLTAVQFHGELYVVEGNRRLWCIKEAQRRLQGKLVVPVRVPNLYLGFIHRQEHKEPALPYFLQRYDPRFEGKRAEVFIESDGPPKFQPSDRTTGTSTSELSQGPQALTSPRCPKCAACMSVRTNGRDGSKFWGCSKYPGCKGTINMPSIDSLS